MTSRLKELSSHDQPHEAVSRLMTDRHMTSRFRISRLMTSRFPIDRLKNRLLRNQPPFGSAALSPALIYRLPLPSVAY
jgi:hypothetical protein